MFKILDTLPTKRQVVTSELTEDGVSVVFSDGGTFLITSFLSAENYGLKWFEFYPVVTPYVGEAQFVTVKSKEFENKTIGYVFPISSLRFKSILESKKQWIQVYGRAASLAILRNGVLNEQVSYKQEIDINDSTFDVTDILPNNVGIAIFGKEQLNKSGGSIKSIKIVLQEHGYKLLPNSRVIKNNSNIFFDTLSIRKISDGLHGDVDKLLHILNESTYINSVYSKFLCLYQVCEIVIEKIFSYYIDEIRLSPEYSVDPWKVRDRISSISNEKWRLSKIRSDFVIISNHQKYYDELKDACLSFLLLIKDDIDFVDDGKKDWCDLLYLVRNTIVHRQAMVIGSFSSELDIICDRLELLCFKIIVGYRSKQLI